MGIKSAPLIPHYRPTNFSTGFTLFGFTFLGDVIIARSQNSGELARTRTLFSRRVIKYVKYDLHYISIYKSKSQLFYECYKKRYQLTHDKR